MGRWAPDARGRLGEAAMALYLERGYDQTTVADIADRAGLTSRTFFRYFADKREVLFDSSDALLVTLAQGVADAPRGASALEAVAAALDAVARRIGTDRAFSRQRQEVIEAHEELRERELVKLASWSRVVAEALRARGIRPADASLAAESGVAVFRVAFARWLDLRANRSLAAVLRESFSRLHALTS